MLYISDWHYGVTVQIPHFAALSILFPDISVGNGSLFLQPVFQSVIKALFDILSDCLEIQIYMRCNTIIIVYSYQIRIIFLD